MTKVHLRKFSGTLAWASKLECDLAVYVLEARRGAQYRCPGCGAIVRPVNSHNPAWKHRPHFRHETSRAEDQRCRTAAAEVGIRHALEQPGTFELPGYEVRKSVQGVRGVQYVGMAVAGLLYAQLARCSIEDEALFVLRLPDGRCVDVYGRGRLSQPGFSAIGSVHLEVNDEQLCAMSAQAIREHLYLNPTAFTWVHHCDQERLQEDAQRNAREAARNAIELDSSTDLPVPWKHESNLHREAKEILAQAKVVIVPFVPMNPKGPGPWGTKEVTLTDVRLEHRVGRIIPDLVCCAGEKEMLIEITVTHPLEPLKLDRLPELGLPVLEIDLRKRGGTVNREELRKILVEDIDCKSWAYHPRLATAAAKSVNTTVEVDKPKSGEQPENNRVPAPITAWWPRRWVWCIDRPNAEARYNVEAVTRQHEDFLDGRLRWREILRNAHWSREDGQSATDFLETCDGNRNAIAHLLWAGQLIQLPL